MAECQSTGRCLSNIKGELSSPSRLLSDQGKKRKKKIISDVKEEDSETSHPPNEKSYAPY